MNSSKLPYSVHEKDPPLGGLYPSPFTSHQVIHYNDLVSLNQKLSYQNQALLRKVEKYEQLAPYIDTLISKNSVMEMESERIATENNYFHKQIRQLHVELQAKDQELLHSQQAWNSRVREFEKMLKLANDDREQLKSDIQRILEEKKILSNEFQKSKEDHLCMMRSKQHLEAEIAKLESFNREIVGEAKKRDDQQFAALAAKGNEISGLNCKLVAASEENRRLEIALDHEKEQLFALKKQYEKLQSNHEQLLDAHRKTNLKKVEAEELLAQEQQRRERRQQQLKQIQEWRQNERNKYKQELSEREKLYAKQISEYKQILSQKKVKIDQLLSNNQKLTDWIEQLEQVASKHEQQISSDSKTMKNLALLSEQREEQVNRLRSEVIRQRHAIEAKQRERKELSESLLQKSFDYENLQQQLKKMLLSHELELQQLKNEFSREQQRSYERLIEEKQKMLQVHEYEKEQFEYTCRRKVELLEAEVERYQAKSLLALREKSATKREPSPFHVGKTVNRWQ